MKHSYDINVKYDALCTIKERLKYIDQDLEAAINKMKSGIKQSESYLSGNQFEKAKNTTNDCLLISDKTRNNISYACKYIEELKQLIEDYSKCTYNEE